MKKVLELLEQLLSLDPSITEEKKEDVRNFYKDYIKDLKKKSKEDLEFFDLSLITVAGELAHLILEVKTDGLPIKDIEG